MSQKTRNADMEVVRRAMADPAFKAASEEARRTTERLKAEAVNFLRSASPAPTEQQKD